MTNNELLFYINKAIGSLEDNKKILNEINLFPIADNDTGENLIKTLKGAIDGVESSDDEIDTTVLKNKFLFSSKGSSGTILSIYLIGLLSKNSLDIDTARYSFNALTQSILNPKLEGTLLDGLSIFMNYNYREPFIHWSERELFIKVVKSVETNIDYKNKNIFDSGLLALFYIMSSYNENSNFVVNVNEQFDASKSHYYCFELNLNNTLDDNFLYFIREMKDSDEQIFLNMDSKSKIHIHTCNPHLLLKEILNKGYVIDSAKIDLLY